MGAKSRLSLCKQRKSRRKLCKMIRNEYLRKKRMAELALICSVSKMMQVNEDLICRLCLKMCGSTFEAIEDATLEMMDFLLLNLDLGVSNEPVLCDSCLISLKRCYDFKADCLRKDHYVNCLVNDEDIKPNMTQICLSEKANTDKSDNGSICYFCNEPINNEFAPLQDQDVDVRVMLHKYFPEIVFDINEHFAVCIPCHGSLQSHFSFLSSCMDVEENIREYCRIEGTNSKGQIVLKHVVDFKFKNTVQNNVEYSELISVKEEIDYLKCVKTEVKDENDIKIEPEFEN